MLSRIRHSIHGNGDWLAQEPANPSTRRSNRRRLFVFLGMLIVALAVSLTYVWIRPPEYRASARVEITPAAAAAPSASAEASRPFLTEVQILTSRPVLEVVGKRLERLGQDISVFGADAAAGMQTHLEVAAVAGTNVVELIATGATPELLAPLVNTTIDVYRDRLADAYDASSSEAIARADEEVKKLDANVTARRRAIEAFRIRYNIVSLERDENQVLAQTRNLAAALGPAHQRVAAADGNLRALNESIAAGSAAVRQRDEPALANLEQRASQMRAELREMERTYTADYMAREPKAVEQRKRLADLESQIKAQREESQKAALADARQELAIATAAVSRIQEQIASSRGEVGQFTMRYNEYKSQQEQLADLEKALRESVQNRAKIEASERARMPAIKIIEAAAGPQHPWRPPYWRDTGISIGGSLLLALLTMGLVELFNRSAQQPTMVLVPPQSSGLTLEGGLAALPGQHAPLAAVQRSEPRLLAQQTKLPRELNRDEVAALVQASGAGSRLIVLLLLSGLTVDEAIALRAADFDLARGVLRVGGESVREIAISDPLRAELVARTTSVAS